MEEEFSLKESFFAKYNPFSWNRKTVVFALLSFYLLFGVAFFLIGLTPAEAKQNFDTEINIASIGLNKGVVDVENVNGKLETPDELVGRYSKSPSTIFLFGHSVSGFLGLDKVKIGEIVEYGESEYVVKNTTIMAKTDINMNKLLAYSEKERIVLMTCYGEEINGEYRNRLIVEAVKIE